MKIPTSKFWKNKNVVITGHTGFTGAWLSQVLIFWGANIHGISLKPNTNPSLFKILKLEKKITSHHECDINEYKKVEKIFKKINPEIIFHLAAQPIVKKAHQDPINTFSTNICGTLNVCEASRKIKKLKSLVLITTDKVYENSLKKEKRFFNENDRLGGNEPYSVSKVAAEMIIKTYKSIFFDKKRLIVSTARAGNIIGGGDWGMYRLIPDIFRSFNKKIKISIRNPNAIRPWQHVLDAVNGYILLAESNIGGSWNFGPIKKSQLKVIEILKIFKKKENNLKWKIKKEKKIKETKYLNLNIQKSKKFLKWSPKLNIHETLNKTIEWYNSFYKKKDMIKITNQHIKEYYKS